MNLTMIELIKKGFPKRSFSTKEAVDLGVSKRMLSYLTRKGLIERLARGVYALAEIEDNGDFQHIDLVHTALGYKEAVICLLSALSYWDLTDEIPRHHWIAIPNNQPTPKAGGKINFYRPRNLKDGVIKKIISGETVKITNPERSVVESFKYFDEETGIHALEHYLQQDSTKIDLKYLLNIAHALKAKKFIDVLRRITTSQAKNYPQLNQETLADAISWMSEEGKSK